MLENPIIATYMTADVIAVVQWTVNTFYQLYADHI